MFVLNGCVRRTLEIVLGWLWLAARCPSAIPSLPFNSRTARENKMKNSWIKTKTRISYLYTRTQSTHEIYTLQRLSLIHCLKIDWFLELWNFHIPWIALAILSVIYCWTLNLLISYMSNSFQNAFKPVD